MTARPPPAKRALPATLSAYPISLPSALLSTSLHLNSCPLLLCRHLALRLSAQISLTFLYINGVALNALKSWTHSFLSSLPSLSANPKSWVSRACVTGTKLGFQRRNSKAGQGGVAVKLPALVENSPTHTNSKQKKQQSLHKNGDKDPLLKKHKKERRKRELGEKVSAAESGSAVRIEKQQFHPPRPERRVQKRPNSRRSPHDGETKLPKVAIATDQSMSAAREKPKKIRDGPSGIKPPKAHQPPVRKNSSLPNDAPEEIKHRADSIAKQLEDDLAALGSESDEDL